MNTRSSIGAIIGALGGMFQGPLVTKQRARYFSLFYDQYFYIQRDWHCLKDLQNTLCSIVFYHLDYDMEVSIPQ
jgi:hypothetical protein